MTNKQKKLFNDKKLRELKVSDSLTNLEEFTRNITSEIDFNCFDVLSITRLDCDDSYTRNFAHPHVDPQQYRASSGASEAIALSIVKNKLN